MEIFQTLIYSLSYKVHILSTFLYTGSLLLLSPDSLLASLHPLTIARRKSKTGMTDITSAVSKSLLKDKFHCAIAMHSKEKRDAEHELICPPHKPVVCGRRGLMSSSLSM
jgi:hypothetical protein